MAELLQGPLPHETEATCDDCAMLPGRERAASEIKYFDPVSKCCSYLPVLPNFLVGAILADPDGPGRRSIEARIDARLGVRPVGLAKTPAHAAVFEHVGLRAFGRTPSLRCPHQLDGGHCGIWLHRNAVCATWYCKHVRGSVGAVFWRDGVERLLRAVEVALSWHCLVEVGVAPRSMLALTSRGGAEDRRLSNDLLIDEVDDADYAQLWGTWRSREREFFLRCASVVEAMSWNDVIAVAGPDIKLLAASTKELHHEVRSKAIPTRLEIGSIRVVGTTEEGVCVQSYSEYDAIVVPTDLFAVLHRFEGRTVREARALLESEDGIEVDDAFLRTLIDFDILRAHAPLA